MSVSAIGASPVQSLVPYNYLTAPSSASSSSNSSTSTADSVSLSTQAQLLAGIQGSGASPTAQGGGSFQQDMAQLGQMVNSGDLSGAQSLYQSMQAKMQGHHHHHHHGGSTQGSSSTGTSTGSAPSTTGTSSTGNPGSAGGFASAFQALGAALNSGDLAAAQSAWTNLSSGFQGSTQNTQS
jgi:hypothetical protein